MSEPSSAQRPVRKVVVTWDGWEERILAEAQSRGRGDIEIVVTGSRQQVLRHVVDADAALVGLWDPEIHTAAAKLGWVHAIGGGVTGYLFPEILSSPVPLTCGKACFAIPGAEFGLAAMLHFSRRSHLAASSADDPAWLQSMDHEWLPQDLSGKTLGIIGLGGMGQALAVRAAALGMSVVGARRVAETVPDGVHRLFPASQLPQMLPLCDFVAVAVPQTVETHGLVSEAALRLMKENAYLIDLSGRATVYDFRGLVRAVSQKWIAGVCLQPSGYAPELGMPPPDAEFWRLPNVVVTPCRGTSLEQEQLCLSLFFDNLQSFEEGRPLSGMVDKAGGY